MKHLKFKHWQEFREYIDSDRQVMPVYWRGQRDPVWPLASGFEREILRLNGGWMENASQVYPYDGRYTPSGGGSFWEDGFYAGDA